MLVALAAALLMTAGPQGSATERSRAEQLARSGRTVEAMELFVRLVERDPADVEARLWVARLEMRLGRLVDAEADFRSVLREHPADLDARIGLASVLTRRGRPEEAIALLAPSERDAGENSDFFSALGRAYRRTGDDRRALGYLRRAHVLSPRDPDITSGYEAVARVYRHWLAFEGFTQGGAPGAGVQSGTMGAGVRVAPRLLVDASGRVQQGSGYSDAIGGGGVLWRASRSTTAEFHGRGGPDNIALATSDVSAGLTHYAGVLEIGGGVRRFAFTDARVLAGYPTFAWDPGGRWRFDSRYTYTQSSFDQTGQSRGDHSVMLRQTWRGWRRVAINAVYAYGVESFETLTADRLGSLGMNTVAAGLRIETPSLTTIAATWEHEIRSNQTRVDRLNLSIVQTIP
jgi:tetratricopeptide (TPR) repeat protein